MRQISISRNKDKVRYNCYQPGMRLCETTVIIINNHMHSRMSLNYDDFNGGDVVTSDNLTFSLLKLIRLEMTSTVEPR